MFLDPKRFSREGLISAIADSFLDWTTRNLSDCKALV
jgi:hypothetical protein